MLFGSSYSLIVGNLTSNETYGFEVANFDVEFLDNKKISISGIPETDEDGINNSKEFSFTVSNNSAYDVNYRLDIIEQGSLNMSRVIHYVYEVNNEGYSDVLTLSDNYTIKQNKVLKVNSKDEYKIKIWLSIDADEQFMNKTFSANIVLTATQNEYKYATTVIEKLATSRQDGIIFESGNYRYSTIDANNYLWFNCKEGFTKGDDYCEKWRIIGSFLNSKENTSNEYYMFKIVNTNPIEKVEFNNSENNGDYDRSYIETFANGAYYDKLNDSAKKIIMKSSWNIGNTRTSTNYYDVLISEKSKVYYGNVGLPNVSDYLFLGDNSFINSDNVILLNKSNNQVMILNDGLKLSDNNKTYSFLPCVYLRPDVSILKGDGTIDNPYEMAIKYPMNY